jgi:hypothetical protein
MVVNAELRVQGALYVPILAIGTAYAVQPNDYIVSVNNVGGAVTINLPAPALFTGRIIRIKRYNSTSTGTVTISTIAATTVIENTVGTLVVSFTLGTTATTRRA